MKTQRRHELRENELAQSLEALSDSVRRNSTKITVAVVAAVAVIAAVLIFMNHRAAARRDAWQVIGEPLGEKPDERISKLREVAAQNINSALTAAALARAGDVAMNARDEAKAKNDRAAAEHWSEEARASYRRVVDEFGSIASAALPARMALGILAEGRGDYAEARQIYDAVIADPAARDTPFAAQAQYRLSHFDQWKTPVVFAPASAPASAPIIVTPPAASVPGVSDSPTIPQMPAAAASQPVASAPSGH